MNQNRAPDYNYGMNMNFPSLNQTNQPQNYSGSFAPNLQKGGNPMGHPNNDAFGQNLMYNKFGNMQSMQNMQNLQKQSLASKPLSSQSKNFVPSSFSSNFLGSQQQQQNVQSHDNFNYSGPPGFQNPNPGPLSMKISQIPPNLYPSNAGFPSNSNPHYLASGTPPPGFHNPNMQPMGGNNYFSSANNMPSSTSASFNSGVSTDFSDDREFEKVVEHIANLKFPEKRDEALAELSRKRESFQQLAVYLWHSVGTLAILLQEIVAIYPLLTPQTLSQQVSYKVCNVLGLLQCLALHQDTRSLFLSAHIPLFLYPFLNTSHKGKPFENLRVTSLGVIGALVKGDDSDAIDFLMKTEIIPLCLRIMKRGQELSRTVATFIVQKILLDDNGLTYICQTGERFFAVCTVLNHMITDLATTGKDDQRLLRHIIRCYLRLAENPKANEALRKYLPAPIRDVDQKLITDDAVKKWHYSLLENLGFFESE